VKRPFQFGFAAEAGHMKMPPAFRWLSWPDPKKEMNRAMETTRGRFGFGGDGDSGAGRS
jgi:hypothetical protein